MIEMDKLDIDFVFRCSFQVLNLRNYYDIYEILTYPDRFEIKSQLQKLVQSVEVPSIEIHVDDAIVRLAQSGLKDFDIDKYTDNVSLVDRNSPFDCVFAVWIH